MSPAEERTVSCERMGGFEFGGLGIGFGEGATNRCVRLERAVYKSRCS